MALKKRQKVIGVLSFLLIVFMISNSIFIYMVFVRQTTGDATLNERINTLQEDTQSKLNQLTSSIIETQSELSNVGTQIGSLDKEISNLKASTSSDFSGIIENAIKSVVTVRTDVSQGSGFIIAESANEAYIVTNAHVLEGARTAVIITYDGKSHSVSLTGQDIEMDIALLKISDSSYPVLQLANSDNVQVGEKVIAIGNPLGLQFSVSEGIVSAVDREIDGLNAYIQTDASLNPGNSGGPLVDITGKAIGINNFKIGGSESLGFALESNYIKESVNSIYRQVYGSSLL